MYQKEYSATESTYERLNRIYQSSVLRPNDIAREGGFHPVHVRELLREGKIEGARKIGSRWVIPIAAAAAFLDGETDVA